MTDPDDLSFMDTVNQVFGLDEMSSLQELA